jgi:hypothetical protein
MTITGTISASFLITLGLVLGGIAWGGYFERAPTPGQYQRADLAGKPRTAGIPAPPKKQSVMIMVGRERLRFAAIARDTPKALKDAQHTAGKADAIGPARAPATKPQNVKTASAKARRAKQPTQTAQQWPWLSTLFGK